MATLFFRILNYWHAGTGRGDGPAADAVVARSATGLPYLPGRTVKGLVRDAVELALVCEPELATPAELEGWFGSPLPARVGGDRGEARLEEARFSTRAGSLRFGSATLGEAWSEWARAAVSADKAPLFETLASTRIDARGLASDHSLRSIEVAVPMTLQAAVEGADARAVAVLRSAIRLIRGLGSHRHRGLGRVEVTIEEN